MTLFNGPPPAEEAKPLGSLGRWFQAVTGHFCFVVITGLLLGASLVPAVLCVYGFFSTGALVYTLGWILSGAVLGPVWTAVQRAAWELQFGHPAYLYRSLLHWLRSGLRQGAALGVLGAFLWTLLLSPLAMVLLGGAPVPVWLLILLLIGALALAAAGGYAFYQAARWELRLGEILTNSLLLLIAAGWRTLLAGALWLALPTALILWYPVVFPLCVITGLPVLLCVTAQAVFAPRLDSLLSHE
ncbi:MAG: hypothetical protein K2N78_06825 [Oscillospiraceae bacterium]|nr:hypothetical protein [Oscillospiraceae bacterium]